MSGILFKKPSDSIYHSGSSIGVINNNDTQTQVNEKLAEELQKLKDDKCGTSTTDTSVNNTDNLLVTNQFGKSATYTQCDNTYSINTLPGKNDISIAYDINPLISADSEVISKRVQIEGMRGDSKTILVDSQHTTNIVSLKPENFPATLNVDIVQRNQSGEQRITSKSVLQPVKGNVKEVAYSRDYNTSDISTQTEMNTYLKDRISKLESNTCKLTEVVLDGTTYDLINAIKLLWSEVKSLKNLSLSDYKIEYTDNCNQCGGTVSKTISEAFTSLSQCCCDNTSSINSVKNTVSTQSGQIKLIGNTIGINTSTTDSSTSGETGGNNKLVYVCRDTQCKQVSLSTVADGETVYTDSTCGGGCDKNLCDEVVNNTTLSHTFNESNNTINFTVVNVPTGWSITSPLSYTYTPGIEFNKTFTLTSNTGETCSFNYKASTPSSTNPCSNPPTILSVSYTDQGVNYSINNTNPIQYYYINGNQYSPGALQEGLYLTIGTYTTYVVDNQGCISNTKSFTVSALDSCSGVSCAPGFSCLNGDCICTNPNNVSCPSGYSVDANCNCVKDSEEMCCWIVKITGGTGPSQGCDGYDWGVKYLLDGVLQTIEMGYSDFPSGELNLDIPCNATNVEGYIDTRYVGCDMLPYVTVRRC